MAIQSLTFKESDASQKNCDYKIHSQTAWPYDDFCVDINTSEFDVPENPTISSSNQDSLYKLLIWIATGYNHTNKDTNKDMELVLKQIFKLNSNFTVQSSKKLNFISEDNYPARVTIHRKLNHSRLKINKEDHSIKEKFNQYLEKNPYLPEWEKMGIAKPSQDSIDKACSIFSMVYYSHNLSPHRISASIEEGIFIYYLNINSKTSLSFEVYNDDLTVIASISSDNQIICVKEVIDDDYDVFINKYKSF